MCIERACETLIFLILNNKHEIEDNYFREILNYNKNYLPITITENFNLHVRHIFNFEDDEYEISRIFERCINVRNLNNDET